MINVEYSQHSLEYRVAKQRDGRFKIMVTIYKNNTYGYSEISRQYRYAENLDSREDAEKHARKAARDQANASRDETPIIRET